jgi:class 3 adenylate cyclase
MHRILKEALPTAEGYAEHVVAIIADIRGFSAFSTRHESSDTAMYIRRVYMRLIEDYFPFATFFKSTGDGLLITVRFNDKETLQQAARDSVDACLRCLSEFADICKGDPMINFEVPSGIGFGLTRGMACCLVSSEMVLDYSGHILNLASRLTDLARPRGIVLDGDFGIELLTKKEQKLFELDQVYIRSVSEEVLWPVYVLSGVVVIPEQAKRPLRLEQWEIVPVSKSLKEWRDMGSRFGIPLPKNPKRPDGIEVWISHNLFKGRKLVEGMTEREQFGDFKLIRLENRPIVEIDIDKIVDRVRIKRIPQGTEVKVTVSYVPE